MRERSEEPLGLMRLAPTGLLTFQTWRWRGAVWNMNSSQRAPGTSMAANIRIAAFLEFQGPCAGTSMAAHIPIAAFLEFRGHARGLEWLHS